MTTEKIDILFSFVLVVNSSKKMDIYKSYFTPNLKVLIIDDLSTKISNDPILIVEEMNGKISFGLIALSALTSNIFMKSQTKLEIIDAIKWVDIAFREYCKRPQDYPTFNYKSISERFLLSI